MGRKAIPDNIKVIKGTFQKCLSNPDQPAPIGGTPKKPVWLPRTAEKFFKALIEKLDLLGVLSSTDAGIIALAAQLEDELHKCNKNIERDGMWIYVRNEKGQVVDKKKNPAVTHRKDVIMRLSSVYSELGLTPSSRSKVSRNKKEQAKDSPFAARA
jgi:P27 family predicted phage terminase small subunit